MCMVFFNFISVLPLDRLNSVVWYFPCGKSGWFSAKSTRNVKTTLEIVCILYVYCMYTVCLFLTGMTVNTYLTVICG